MKDKILFFIIGLLVGILVTIGVAFVYKEFIEDDNNSIDRYFEEEMGPRDDFMGKRPDENPEKEVTSNDVDQGTIVDDKRINLDEYDSNITITKGGEYTLTGYLKASVLVNSNEQVKLILDNVDIESSKTSAIANIGKGDLIISLRDNTESTLIDGGSSEYDACIYSNGKITIEGEGILNVYGNQEEGEGIATETSDIIINGGTINIESEDDGINAGGDGGLITINNGEIYIKANGDGIDSNQDLVINGGNIYVIGSSLGDNAAIDTDKGFEINGGTVIAIGSDMMEKPETSSKQKSLSFNMRTSIKTGSKVSIKKDSEEEITSFEAKEDFKTLIYSNANIESGTYYLYENDEKTTYKVTIK